MPPLMCVGCQTTWCHNCIGGLQLIADDPGYPCHHCMHYGMRPCHDCGGLEAFSDQGECGVCDHYLCKRCTQAGQSNYGPTFCGACRLDMSSSSDSDSSPAVPLPPTIHLFDTILTPPGHPCKCKLARKCTLMGPHSRSLRGQLPMVHSGCTSQAAVPVVAPMLLQPTAWEDSTIQVLQAATREC